MARAGLTTSALCPHCGKEDQDLYHLYWGCDVVWRSQHAEISKADFMFGDAYNGRVERACFYLRGLVPIEWTHRQPTDEYNVGFGVRSI